MHPIENPEHNELLKELAPGNKFSSIIAKYHNESIFQVSLSVFYAPITAADKSFKNFTLLEIAELIRSDKLKAITLKLRTINDKKKNSAFKQSRFPFALFSGVFSGFADEKLIKHSGLICIDLDGLGNDLSRIKTTINSDPLLVMSFISPNGDGMKALYRINPEKYTQEQYYRIISKRLMSMCGLSKKKIDSHCSNVSRACILCHDPDIFLNLSI